MEYSQFLKIVEDVSEVEQYREGYDSRKDVLMEKWVSDGNQESPWGITDTQEEPEPRYFVALDLALEELWPEITLLQYNRLCRCLIQYGEDIDEGAYGRTLYNVKYVVLSDLYVFLKSYEKV